MKVFAYPFTKRETFLFIAKYALLMAMFSILATLGVTAADWHWWALVVALVAYPLVVQTEGQ